MSNIAKTIIDQFGAGALYMIGARNLYAGADSIQFDFMRSARTQATRCRIQYNAAGDDYALFFFRRLRDRYIRLGGVRILDEVGGFVEVERVRGLFFDELREHFEAVTGLYTSL